MSESKGRLLIVDDELSVRDSLNKWFREEGYEVGAAENASEALLRLADHNEDLDPELEDQGESSDIAIA